MDDENRFDDERRFIKFWLVAAIVAAAILALAFYPGRPLYRHLKEKRGAAQARYFFDKGDFRNAWLSAQQALVINPNNLEACRVMAELNDLAHSPAALDYYARLVKLSPSITNKLLLASIALRYQSPPYPIASQILDDLSAVATNLPDFHVLSAQLDLSLNRMTEAETQFEAACQLAPTNRLFRLNLAVIRLGSTNGSTAADARSKLKQFTSDRDLGPPALRSLIADRLLHNDSNGALNYSTQLLANTQAMLSDRLQYLGILKSLNSPALTAQLNSLQEEAVTNAVMAAQIASWMEANGYLAQTANWLKTLPADIRSHTPVRLAFIDCYVNATNWPALRDFTASGDWGEADFLRLAFLSRAWNRLGESLVADGNWRSAMSEAGDRLGAMTVLLDLANRWQLAREREDLLWRVMRRFPDARWAKDNLERLYFEAGNTTGLYQLYSKLLDRLPENTLLKNNLAATSLLLKTNLSQAFRLSSEAYAQLSANPSVVSTFAYALHLQGRDPEGLAAMQKLKPAQLEDPSVALYYGVLLSATGNPREAAPYFQIARTKGHLLPEERELLKEIDRQ